MPIPEALEFMFEGRNLGKLVVSMKVSGCCNITTCLPLNKKTTLSHED